MSSPAGAASGGDAGQADAGQAPAEGQQQGQQDAAAEGPYADVLAALQAHTSEIAGLREMLPQGAQQGVQQPGAEPAADDTQQQQGDDGALDLSWLDEPGLDNEAVAARLQQSMDKVVQQRVQDALQQHVAPLAQQVGDLRWEYDAGTLVGEFPEMADPEVANAVVTAAQTMVEARGWPKQLATDPAFIRQTYMAAVASRGAQSEAGAESPAAAHLEGGGGATPSGGPQVDLGDLIVKGGDGARLGARALDF